MTRILFFKFYRFDGFKPCFEMLPFNNILDYLLNNWSKLFRKTLPFYTISSFYVELSNFLLTQFHRILRISIKKVSQGDEYQNFLLKKKFFIHSLFQTNNHM